MNVEHRFDLFSKCCDEIDNDGGYYWITEENKNSIMHAVASILFDNNLGQPKSFHMYKLASAITFAFADNKVVNVFVKGNDIIIRIWE